MSWRSRATPADGRAPSDWRSRALPEEPVEEESGGAGQAALEHYGDAATLGYLPHIQAATAGLMPDPSSDVDEDLESQGFTISEGGDSYIERRDANLKRLKKQEEEHPVASGIGTGVGILATAAVPMGAAAKGATLGAKALQGAKAGAALGAAANPGDTEGVINPLQVEDRAKNAAFGGALGAATPVAVEGGISAAKKVGDFLRKKAALKATRALGRPTPTQARRMAESGQDVALGRDLLDEGAIPVLGTPKRISGRVERLKDEAGEEIDELLNAADAETVSYTPIKIKNPKRLQKVQDEVRVTPVRFDENPIKRAFPNLRPEDAPPSLIRGEEQAIQKPLFEKPTAQVIPGKTKELPLHTVDTKKIADSILKSDELAQMRRTPGMESTVAAIEKQVETLASNGKLTLKEAQALRRGIDKSINFNKAAPEMRGAQEGLYKQRTAVRNAMNDAINNVRGAGKDELLRANRKYGNLSDAEDILEREIGRNQANRAVSLTDTIAAGAGASTGNPLVALGLGALNKAGRTFGNSAQARVYDAIAKKAAGVAAAGAKVNPQVAAQIAARVGTKTPGVEKDPDPILNDQRLMDIFRKDPSLIEAIDDEGTRKKVQRAISGH